MVGRRAAYAGLVAAVAAQRLAEMRTSRRHERALVARGGTVHAQRQLPAAVALHAGWLAGCLAEGTRRLRRPVPAPQAVLGLAGLAVGQGLRLSAMRALGERWTGSVVTVPGAPRVETGVYRWLRHPNYWGVVVEGVALPAVGGVWRTAAAFTVANALFLRARIRAEDAALDAAAGAPPPAPS